MDENNIGCLSETLKKIRDVNFSNNIVIIEQMREINDKKGGGLMILHKNNEDIHFDKLESRNQDIFVAQGNIRGWEFKIVLICLSVNKKREKRFQKNRGREIH